MKLIRFGGLNREKPGICMNGINYDVSGFVKDYNAVFFANGGLPDLVKITEQHQAKLTELPAGARMGCPVASPSKIVCIGLNYADHARETGAATPQEPIIFLKSTTSVSGPYDDIIIPKNSVKTDWEVELAVVICKKASYVDEAEAMDYVAGYLLHNDVSEREFQLERGGTWDKGKGCDTFAPLGPWLVTKDEITDVDNLRLWLKVNDRIMQDGTTADLIFKIPFLVSYISQFMTLLPGDIISTGTPAGVGLGIKPPIYLKKGDIVELGIDGLGTSKQECIAYATG
ncbi:MAG: fumarylacetoacetate hydrolase family protein [Ferruginibacter sp.]|nr:fumarylacetoacetate hydrolase family protein [Chitinophagaceae bacterium]